MRAERKGREEESLVLAVNQPWNRFVLAHVVDCLRSLSPTYVHIMAWLLRSPPPSSIVGLRRRLCL